MKRLLMAFVACLLAACAGGARKAPPADVYDFGMPVQHLADVGQWSNLALEVKVPYWFDSLAIEYRLLYDDPLKLRSYAGSRWAGAPGLLLAQRLRQQIGVVGSGGQTATNCLLRLELQEFSQVFDTPLQSRGLLRGQASLLDSRHRIVGERRVAVEEPAAGVDARGGVNALVRASDALAGELATWLNDQEKRGTLKSCRSTVAESQ